MSVIKLHNIQNCTITPTLCVCCEQNNALLPASCNKCLSPYCSDICRIAHKHKCIKKIKNTWLESCDRCNRIKKNLFYSNNCREAKFCSYECATRNITLLKRIVNVQGFHKKKINKNMKRKMFGILRRIYKNK